MLAIWLPSVFLGVVANRAVDVPASGQARSARDARRRRTNAARRRAATQLRAEASGDDVILKLVEGYAPLWLAALLGAAVMAAVMASDSQILALSTMFTEDVFAFYGGQRASETRCRCRPAALFVVLLTLVAYASRLPAPQSIFDLATSTRSPATRRCRRCWWPRCSGEAARGGARWPTVWTAVAVLAIAVLQTVVPPPPPRAHPSRSCLSRALM